MKMERNNSGEENSDELFSNDVKKFGGLLHEDFYYVKYPDVNLPRSRQIPEIIASGVQYERKHFRVRNKDIRSFVGRKDSTLNHILSVSGAAIGLLASNESNFHKQSFIELIGISDAVTMAETLIADAIKESYKRPFVPIPLMPATVFHHVMLVPAHKVAAITGVNGNTILKMEQWSNAWIEIEPDEAPPGYPNERVVNVYGPILGDANKAVNLVNGIVSSHVEIGPDVGNKQQEGEEGDSSVEAVVDSESDLESTKS